MTLAERLSAYDEKYGDFSEYRNDSPLVRYPAVMVAPMQACILKEIINADPATSIVLDPFCGSGTVLCEGQKLGLNVMGFDINPLAVLIAAVQLEGVPADCAVRSINAINTRLTMLNGNVKPYAFKNIKKWFNDDIIISLSVIRQAIIEETNDRMRRFFWCCFAETVKKFSNTRTSTFKLHVKEQSQIDSTIDDTITFFKEHIQNISLEKQKKVIAFLEDYEAIFSLLARVLKPGKLLVLTLGNRRVDNKEITFDVFNDMLARKYGLELDSTITRNIIGKRMPTKVSSIKEVGAVKSMSKE